MRWQGTELELTLLSGLLGSAHVRITSRYVVLYKYFNDFFFFFFLIYCNPLLYYGILD